MGVAHQPRNDSKDKVNAEVDSNLVKPHLLNTSSLVVQLVLLLRLAFKAERTRHEGGCCRKEAVEEVDAEGATCVQGRTHTPRGRL